MKLRPTQPFWPEVLTDWCVIKALARAGWPESLGEAGGMQAAFVTEISAYLRFRELHLREVEAEARMLSAIEAVHERTGGTAYCSAKEQFEARQSDFLVALGRNRHAAATRLPKVQTTQHLQLQLRKCALELAAYRHPAASAAQAVAGQTATAYWHTISASRIREGFFAEVPVNGAIAAMRAHFDLWWAVFVRSLRTILRQTNLSYTRLLEALPQLRAAAAHPGQKFVLTALVQEWREENGARFGLLKDVHFPVLEKRALGKCHEVEAWFNHHAPGYKYESAVRNAATQALYFALDRIPPERCQRYGNN